MMNRAAAGWRRNVYIIVVGGGKVGYYLTRTLLSEGHEVLLIERESDKVDHYVQ